MLARFRCGAFSDKTVAMQAEKAILDTRTSIKNRVSTKMIVGVMTAQLHMQGIGSLKEKRGIVKSLTGRVKSRFNVSICEVDHQDRKTSAVIALAVPV